jgi:hypothetical protein
MKGGEGRVFVDYLYPVVMSNLGAIDALRPRPYAALGAVFCFVLWVLGLWALIYALRALALGLGLAFYFNS